MSNSFTNQTLAALDLWKNRDSYKVGVQSSALRPSDFTRQGG